MIGTIGGILGWLIANGPTLIAAGTGIADVVSSFFKLFGGKAKDTQVTRAEFDAFVNECLGDDGKRLAIIAVAQGDLGQTSG